MSLALLSVKLAVQVVPTLKSGKFGIKKKNQSEILIKKERKNKTKNKNKNKNQKTS